MSVAAEYRKSLKRVEVEELPDLVLFRPLGFLFVKSIFRTNITPNQITVISLFVGILSGISFGIGRPRAVVLGGLLFGLSIVLDCADGQLARLKRNGTRLGRILDGLIDYIVTFAVYLGIGIGLAPQSKCPWLWWAALAVTGASHIFHSALVDYFRTRFLDHVDGASFSLEEDDYRAFEAERNALGNRKGHVLRKAAIGLYLRYLRMQKRMAARAAVDARGRRLSPDAFAARNGTAMRGWTLLGPSVGGVLLIVSAFAGRFDFYFWGRIVVMNLWAALMFFIQMRIDRAPVDETVS
jgi:phosphatidylglycerophosphate synthase